MEGKSAISAVAIRQLLDPLVMEMMGYSCNK
jgi:hypothetical protein